MPPFPGHSTVPRGGQDGDVAFVARDSVDDICGQGVARLGGRVGTVGGRRWKRGSVLIVFKGSFPMSHCRGILAQRIAQNDCRAICPRADPLMTWRSWRVGRLLIVKTPAITVSSRDLCSQAPELVAGLRRGASNATSSKRPRYLAAASRGKWQRGGHTRRYEDPIRRRLNRVRGPCGGERRGRRTAGSVQAASSGTNA